MSQEFNIDLRKITETNEELIEMRERAQRLVCIWADKEALQAYIRKDVWNYGGVCAVIGIDILATDGLSDQIVRNFKGVHINVFNEPDTCYPIGGRKEYAMSTSEKRWSNPKRLQYAKHTINMINEIIKLRSLQGKRI